MGPHQRDVCGLFGKIHSGPVGRHAEAFEYLLFGALVGAACSFQPLPHATGDLG
jgi:hypothetical protein